VEDTPSAPIQEVEVCEKSPVGGNFAKIEEEHPEWLRGCYKKATKVVMQEFNEFYKKFAEFLDRLAWTAGCGMTLDSRMHKGDRTSPWLQISDENDGGSFGECDWDHEQKMDENVWVLDATHRSRGWTGTSKIQIDEQKQIKMNFPMPLWLKAIGRYSQCFKNTAEGKITEELSADGEDVSSTMNSILGPAAQASPETMDSFREHAALAAQRARDAHNAHAARAAHRAHADHAAHAANVAHRAHHDHTLHAIHGSHDSHADHTAQAVHNAHNAR
jgi:ElaB/YqjD/DUF883 family membrane-anchored ribosome-binding protein